MLSETEDLTWIISLDGSSFAPQLRVGVAIVVKRALPNPPPLGRDDAQIEIAMEFLPLQVTAPPAFSRFSDFRSVSIAALDLDFAISDEERREATLAVIDELVAFVAENSTEADLRARYAEGAFASAFVAPHVRSVLNEPSSAL